MNSQLIFLTIILLVISLSCSKENDLILTQKSASNIDTELCGMDNIMRSKVFVKEEGTFLWGGENEDDHFDISNFSLDVCKLNYGLGREHFKALLQPKFERLSQMKWPIDSLDKAVVIKLNNGNARVYPYSILRAYETVNDVVDGNRIAVVLCFLADLAVVYERTYCNQIFTFAVSGYTYLDQDIQGGLESFVLWDRDTESLWWPIIDKAVSGPMKGHGMHYSNKLDWEIMRMHEVEDAFPTAEILMSGQTFNPPNGWISKKGC